MVVLFGYVQTFTMSIIVSFLLAYLHPCQSEALLLAKIPRELNEEPAAVVDKQPIESFVALCISGQMRTLNSTIGSIKENIIVPFWSSGFDVTSFLFLNLDDGDSSDSKFSFASGRGGNNAHSDSVIPPILKFLQPAVYQRYTTQMFQDIVESNRNDSQCMAAPGKQACCHFSYHGPLFWSTNQCFDMIKKQEKLHNKTASWVIHARPDTVFNWQFRNKLQSIVTEPNSSYSVWLGGDIFSIMKRSALDAFASTWSEFFDNKCKSLPAENCPAYQLKDESTECLLLKHLKRARVPVSFRGDLRAPILRPRLR